LTNIPPLRYLKYMKDSTAVRPERSFQDVTRVKPDNKGRITLGKLAKGVSSYAVRVDDSGRVLLEPYAEIPARERWLFKNSTARNRTLRGLADAGAGRVRSLGSFARHADGRDDD